MGFFVVKAYKLWHRSKCYQRSQNLLLRDDITSKSCVIQFWVITESFENFYHLIHSNRPNFSLRTIIIFHASRVEFTRSHFYSQHWSVKTYFHPNHCWSHPTSKSVLWTNINIHYIQFLYVHPIKTLQKHCSYPCSPYWKA